MKAFKGCMNENCSAHKKIHYKNDDQFCKRCGLPLSYVCAECWKSMDSNDNRLCVSCEAKKEEKNAQRAALVKNSGSKVLATIGGTAAVVATLGKDADKLVNGAKKVADAGVKIAKAVKK